MDDEKNLKLQILKTISFEAAYLVFITVDLTIANFDDYVRGSGGVFT